MSRLMLRRLAEPRLRFGLDQSLEDPRDGLTLFGPLDEGKTFGVRPAVIGTAGGIRRFWDWAAHIQRPIDDGKFGRPPFPGFEAAFSVPFGQKPLFEVPLDEQELIDACRIDDRYQRVHRVVRLYADKIKAAVKDEAQADVWFVMVPDVVYVNCRPESVVSKDVRTTVDASLGRGISEEAHRDTGLVCRIE